MKRILFIFMLLLLVSCVPKQEIQETTQTEYQTYLPIIIRDRAHRMGIEIEGPNVVSKVEDYYLGDFEKVSFHWAHIEPLPGYYDWSYTDAKVIPEADLYVSVYGSPTWANGTDKNCALPLPQYQDEFIAWVLAIIERYNPIYLSLWREPDTSYDDFDMYFGCVGENYSDGVAYGKLFNLVYTEVKLKYPDLKIFAGELMNPDENFYVGMMDTIIRADGISFHHYPRCNTDYTMDHKLIRLRSKTSLPLYMTEGSLIYDKQSLECDQQQIEYFNYLWDNSDIEFFVWYTLGCNGWENADMIFPCNPVQPKPVYFVYESVIK